MKHLSPYTINLTVNLEGVYGIILACILFHENKDLSVTFYVGFGIILSVIFINALLKQKGTKHLRYFPKAPIKKDYVVLPKIMLKDMRTLRHWVGVSIEYALTLPEPIRKKGKM